MERECFEDDEVAEVLNKNFISIKVDREERPDIDNIYMTACQALTGSGGWPLSVFLTSDKKPFYAGTYFPKKSKYGMPGFIDILQSITKAWHEDQERILGSGDSLTYAISKFTAYEMENVESEELIKEAVNELYSLFDDVYGGLGSAPKFPTPHNLIFLLRYWKVSKDKKALDIVEKSLEAMYKGGIFDHIGFGFSRYSTDEKWLVPHFEKMLYDNALLAYVYCEAYAVTKKNLYKETAEKIFKYILRDMTSEEGGFYSAEDADSEGVEGKFYVWNKDDIKKVLGDEDGEEFCRIFDVTGRGNFEGENIPNLINEDLNELQNNKELLMRLEGMRKKLFEYREKRIHPFKDDKILTSWNGLMIAAFSYGGRLFNNEKYTNAAEKAVDFIMKKMVRKDGRLLARYRQGETAHLAYLQDYSFLVWALIELYETTFKIEYLDKALKFNEDMLRLFEDKEKGGLYLYGRDGEDLIVRPKEIYDGAIPSGNSVSAHNILKILRITGDEELENKVKDMFELFGGKVKKNPLAYIHLISSIMESTAPAQKIVIAGNSNDSSTEEMLQVINNNYNPFRSVILNNKDEKLYNIIPMIKEQSKIDNKVTAYVCEGFNCKNPVITAEQLKGLI
jgi:uncharacterized protein YyaL (SSP411 family)